MLPQVTLYLLAALSGYWCMELTTDDSDDSLVKIIEGCEWTSRQNVISEILLDRYRKYAMYNFFLLDDVCAVHEWNKNLKDPEFSESSEVEDSNPPNAQNTQEHVPGDNHPPPAAFNRPVNSSCTKSAKDFFICLSNQLGDPTLNAMLLDNLELACDPRYSPASTTQKRNSKYVSKQKFYSWGGKRNNPNVFYPWGGKRNTGRVHRQPKVVIRNPFHAWGGKRNLRDENIF
ncbi:hypothetical protein RP20_CCG017453 [Aedes albopictus]|nr:hypothetical protein RP20_CCG017453 [Aedes albopictus]